MSLADQLNQLQAKMPTGQRESSLVQGISIPVKVQTRNGKLRVGILLSAEAAQSPEAFAAALEYVESTFGELDVSTYQSGGSRFSGFGGNSYRRNWR